MKTDQKLRNMKSKKRMKDAAKSTQMKQHVREMERDSKNIKNEQKCVINIDIIEYERRGKQKQTMNYVALFQKLTEIADDEKIIRQMDTGIVPYEIPKVYSLKQDIEELAMIKKRTDVLKRYMCRKDIDAMSGDWKKVGEDINEAICKSGRIYARESD